MCGPPDMMHAILGLQARSTFANVENGGLLLFIGRVGPKTAVASFYYAWHFSRNCSQGSQGTWVIRSLLISCPAKSWSLNKSTFKRTAAAEKITLGSGQFVWTRQWTVLCESRSRRLEPSLPEEFSSTDLCPTFSRQEVIINRESPVVFFICYG